MSSTHVQLAEIETVPHKDPVPVNLQQLMELLKRMGEQNELYGTVNVRSLADQLQRTLYWGNRNSEIIGKIINEILEKGEKENLCHKTSENVWKYGPRPKTVENEIQSKMQPEQKDEIAKNRRLASLRKKKIKSILRRQNKRTTKRSSKIYSNTNDSSQFNKEHGEKYVTEINSECVTGGLFRSTLKQTQLSQANRRPKRRRQRSTIAGRAFTREELLKILAELDEAESKNGSDQVKMKSDIKLKQRKSIRRGRGRGRGRVRGVSANGIRKEQSKRTKSAASRRRKRASKQKQSGSGESSSTTDHSSISAKHAATVSEPKLNPKPKSLKRRLTMRKSTKRTKKASLRIRSKRAKFARKRPAKRSSRKITAQNDGPGGDSQIETDDQQQSE